MRRTARHSTWLFGIALLAAPVLFAQNATESRLREALRQTADKLHATEADLAQQQLATAAAEHERDALKQAPRAAHADAGQAIALQRRLAAADTELAQARADAQKWQAAQQASAQATQAKEAERSALAGQLAQQRAQLERCVGNDEAMYATGLEITALYRDPQFADHVRNLHLKPLGFSRVREENRMRTLEDRFAEQHAQMQRCHVADTASGSPAAPTSSPAPAQPASSTTQGAQ